MNGQNRDDIYAGLTVDIILKKDQGSRKLTRGQVQDVLTSSLHHSRGIKVRLTSGEVGRVAQIPAWHSHIVIYKEEVIWTPETSSNFYSKVRER